MPKRTDISTIFIIGAGPIVIGQACEFDYSGVQACRALKQEGYRIVLINSNPASIMTDPDLADATYIEPITSQTVESILRQERQKSLKEKMVMLPTMGGQVALNIALILKKQGVLDELEIELIGARAESIEKAEDRSCFRKAMESINLLVPKSYLVTSTKDSLAVLDTMSFPLILRPSFTLGGSGGGIAYNHDDYDSMIKHGLSSSPVGSVLVEESLIGWKEFEMEVVRDQAGNGIIVCSIENMDPMGIHTGDSITVAPALTLTDKEYQNMRTASLAILDEIGVETGGANVQFAVNPCNGRMMVIEMNPRVSRSSALASKATGWPIARIAALLAIGYTLNEINNDLTGVMPASFEPTLDYIVVKIPRFSFEKFQTDDTLTTSMHAIGEVMAIGRNFAQAIQKALCSLEKEYTGFDSVDIDMEDLICDLQRPHPEQILKIGEAIRRGISLKKIHTYCHVDLWFLQAIQEIIFFEKKIKASNWKELLFEAKCLGFSDQRIAHLCDATIEDVYQQRLILGIRPTYFCIDTCSSEFPGKTAYLYSSYERPYISNTIKVQEFFPSKKDKVIVLGSGPNRIGQGIEFDYACVHALQAVREAGLESIMINCNPATVSTDYDMADRLYFEPIVLENILDIIDFEKKQGYLRGVLLQFGGQTPLKLAYELTKRDIPVLGTVWDSIDCAENRGRFSQLIQKLSLNYPSGGIVNTLSDALLVIARIGYPVLLRPSYVLGGRSMEIIYTYHDLKSYFQKHSGPILIDRYLENAIEIDVDALCDGQYVYVAGIMEHIEEAGVHSGDSCCCLPTLSLTNEQIIRIKEHTQAITKELQVVGLMNIQYAIKEGIIYVLEANPRASRTVPFIMKATGIPLANIATRLCLGKMLSEYYLPDTTQLPYTAVKAPIYPFDKFSNVDIVLGPEMRSTGESMGIDRFFPQAFWKAQEAVGQAIPRSGTIFISVRDQDKLQLVESVRCLVDIGFHILATFGTANSLEKHGIPVTRIYKVQQGRPNIIDKIIDNRVNLVFNTTEGKQSLKDSVSIRRAAMNLKIPYFTTLEACQAVVLSIKALQYQLPCFLPLQNYLKRIGGDMERVLMTKEGAVILEGELQHLKKVERPAIIQAIATAREHGDLSENAEYSSARERQGFIEGRIRQLEDALARAEIIDHKVLTGDTVKFGASVKLVDLDTEEEVIYQIVGGLEADIEKNKISIASPLGRSLIGRKKDEEITVITPKGTKNYIILDISFV